jgi:transposase-like protein
MTEKEIYKRYSEAFKRQVVAEYEAGASGIALCRKYGIGAIRTVQGWVKQYGREGLRHETVHIQTPAEALQVQALTHDLTLLRQVIADLTVKNLLLEGTVQVYRETYGDSVLKKNGKPSSAPPMLPEGDA